MLDTRTTIRNFRDLQFDLKALLDGLHELESGGTVVTLKWSDGAMYRIPTYEYLHSLVGNAFDTVYVGKGDNGVGLTADSGLHIDGSLSSKIVSVIRASIVFSRCNIGTIQAELVKLGNAVKISSFGAVAILASTVLTATDQLTFGRLTVNSLYVDVLDNSAGVHEVERVHSDVRRYPADSYLSMLRSGEFHSHMVLDGYMKTYDATVLTRTYESVTVYAPYIENGAPFTQYPVVAGSNEVPEGEYARLSAVNLTLLYPYKQFGNTSSTVATLTMEAPRAEDQYKVVTVRNVASHGIRACSVWTFNQDTYAGARRVRIVPIRYVNIPPYSAIDFIFSFTYTNDTLTAYMLPTKVLHE